MREENSENTLASMGTSPQFNHCETACMTVSKAEHQTPNPHLQRQNSGGTQETFVLSEYRAFDSPLENGPDHPLRIM